MKTLNSLVSVFVLASALSSAADNVVFHGDDIDFVPLGADSVIGCLEQATSLSVTSVIPKQPDGMSYYSCDVRGSDVLPETVQFTCEVAGNQNTYLCRMPENSDIPSM